MGLFESSWKVTNFKVVLAQEEVMAGQYVSGNVQFEVTAEMPFRRLYIDVFANEFTVVEKVAANNTRSGGIKTQTCRVFAHQITLLGQHATKDTKSSNLKSLTLAPGTYDFPFAVQIPIDAAPTIRDLSTVSSASIAYKASAVLDVPFINLYTDPQAITEFAVITPMPTAQYIQNRPAENSNSTMRLKCGCCPAGNTHCKVSISNNILLLSSENTATVDVTLSLDNSTSEVDIKTVSVALRRGAWATASGYENKIYRLICNETVDVNLAAGEGERRITTRLSVPPTFSRRFGPSYCGTLLVQHYEITVMCGRQVLGAVFVCVADALDDTNTALQIPTVARKVPAKTLYSGPDYPRLVYAPPPESTLLVPAGMEIHVPRATANGPAAVSYNVVEASATNFSREPAAGTVMLPPSASTPLIAKPTKDVPY